MGKFKHITRMGPTLLTCKCGTVFYTATKGRRNCVKCSPVGKKELAALMEGGGWVKMF